MRFARQRPELVDNGLPIPDYGPPTGDYSSGPTFKTFLEEYESIPSFQVNPQQKGLIHTFPKNVPAKFLQDYTNPLKIPAVDHYIFNRLIHDQDQPFPVT